MFPLLLENAHLFSDIAEGVRVRDPSRVLEYSGTRRDPLIAVHRTGSGIVISAGLPECLEKVSPALAVLPLVSCISPASLF
jgi:hypothetical protein